MSLVPPIDFRDEFPFANLDEALRIIEHLSNEVDHFSASNDNTLRQIYAINAMYDNFKIDAAEHSRRIKGARELYVWNTQRLEGTLRMLVAINQKLSSSLPPHLLEELPASRWVRELRSGRAT